MKAPPSAAIITPSKKAKPNMPKPNRSIPTDELCRSFDGTRFDEGITVVGVSLNVTFWVRDTPLQAKFFKIP
jgi:hypothetical protein